MTTKRTIQIYYDLCIKNKNKILIYSQYARPRCKTDITKIKIKANDVIIKTSINFCGYDEFIIEIEKDDINEKICILFENEILYENINLNILEISGSFNTSIVTMIKNYENRIIEWINYNLKLGFEKIILFDNLSSDNLIESVNNLNDNRIVIIPFHYQTIHPHWNTLQRIVFSIGTNLLQKHSRYIALIDADEFIMMPNQDKMNINTFLENYNETLHIQQVIITNLIFSKKDKDTSKKLNNVNNNILDICKYTDFMQDNITKIILYTNYNENDKLKLIPSPHTINLGTFSHNWKDTLSPLRSFSL